MALFLLLMLLSQAPENAVEPGTGKHRGPAAEMAQINITKEGPLVIPSDLVVKLLIGAFSGYTGLLVFGGKWIWKKRQDEVGIIKTDLEKANLAVKSDLEKVNLAVKSDLEKVNLAVKADLNKATQAYELNRVETNAMILKLDNKVDRHHETIMGVLLKLEERRASPRGDS